MSAVRMSGEGVWVGRIWVPPFQLKTGEVLCWHMPGPPMVEEELLPILTGQRLVPGFRVCGRVVRARPVLPTRSRLFGFFPQPRVGDWLCREVKVSRSEAERIGDRLGLRPDWRVSRLAMSSRTLLGLEAALAQAPDILIFSTVGCDPSGIKAVFEAVSSRRDRCASIYLSYPVLQNGQSGRTCFPGGSCLELQRRSDSLEVVKPAPGRD